MTVHLVKLCVGASSIDDLARWQAQARNQKRRNGEALAFHTTFQKPTREADLLDGGSLYWVMKGTILVRQEIAGLEEGRKTDGTPCCVILLKPALLAVRPTPRRAFQGWRYLSADDAPGDLKRGGKDQTAAMPAAMRRELAALGLI